jgi:hypothetical protein
MGRRQQRYRSRFNGAQDQHRRRGQRGLFARHRLLRDTVAPVNFELVAYEQRNRWLLLKC